MADSIEIENARKRLIEIFGEICWMGYRIHSKNRLTFHHIVERRNGGKDTIDNGAILTRHAHDDLNQLEIHARSMYRDLNALFTELNETKAPPTIEYFKEINKILLVANRIINLSGDCVLDMGFIEEQLDLTSEGIDIISEDEYVRVKGVYIPVSYQRVEKDYSSVVSCKEGEEVESRYRVYLPCDKELVEIPAEYKGKVKRKNRNNKKFTYRTSYR